MSFMAKLHGVRQDFEIQGDQIVNRQGTPVDGNELIYPSYDPMLGLTATKQQPTPRYAEIHQDEFGDIAPQPALPIAYGDEEEDEPDPEDGSFGGLFGDGIGGMASKQAVGDKREAMVREALKNFSTAEKDALINEGEGGARNGHLLSLQGTHYEMQQGPEEEDNDTISW